MSYIEPNTNIYFLKSVPLSKNYRNTVYYSNLSEQWAGFSKYIKFSVTKQSYLRSGIGSLKVEASYKDLCDCNYMIFENASYENKKFYAFINGISYVSNTVTAVYFQLDVMQTWCYDYDFLQCYVDRQHATTDELGENTQPEGLDIGPAYTYSDSAFLGVTQWVYYILATSFPDGTAYKQTQFTEGILNGLYTYSTLDVNNAVSVLNTFIDNGLEDAIVSIYMAPPNPGTNPLASTVRRINKGQTLSRYTPRNNKLYQYPYTCITVNNNLGIEQTFKPELFPVKNNGFDCMFNQYVSCYPQPIMVLTPVNYMTANQDSTINVYQQSVTYSVFPTVAFSGDSFKVWWAQNKNSYLASLSNIQTNKDLSISLAGTNYTIAKASAQASQQQTNNTANNQLANARSDYNVSVENSQRTYDSSIKNKISEGLSDVSENWGMGSGILTYPNKVLSQAVGGVAELMNASARANQTNANRSANVALLNTSGSVNTAIANAQIAYDTAIQNATLTREASELSAITTAQTETASLMAKKQDAEMQPNTAHCLSSCDGFNAKFGLVGFYIQLRTIKKEYLEQIDNYFDLYGYAQRKLYKPTRLNRKKWSYLKTTGASLKGSFNQSDITTIEEIYNNGITTWASLESVGDYSGDNGTL